MIFIVQQSFLFAAVELAYLKYMSIKANEICKVTKKAFRKCMHIFRTGVEFSTEVNLNQDGNAGRCISGRIHKSEALRNAQKQHF
jgi:hypothetical protein